MRRLLLLTAPSLIIGALAVLSRGYPTTNVDGGIFLSVAGRLLVGARLYRDVFDNKDPLFYFSQAPALWAVGWRGPFLMDIGWLVVASVGVHLLLKELTDEHVAHVVAGDAFRILEPLCRDVLHVCDPASDGHGHDGRATTASRERDEDPLGLGHASLLDDGSDLGVTGERTAVCGEEA